MKVKINKEMYITDDVEGNIHLFVINGYGKNHFWLHTKPEFDNNKYLKYDFQNSTKFIEEKIIPKIQEKDNDSALWVLLANCYLRYQDKIDLFKKIIEKHDPVFGLWVNEGCFNKGHI